MGNLIKTQNSDIMKPYSTDVALGSADYYYLKNGFLDLDLTDVTCAQLRADANYTPEQCLRIINDIQSTPEQIAKAFQRAMCDNKAAAVQLQNMQKSLNSATQGLDDSKEFYNTMFIQTMNLALGTTALLGASVYFYNYQPKI